MSMFSGRIGQPENAFIVFQKGAEEKTLQALANVDPSNPVYNALTINPSILVNYLSSQTYTLNAVMNGSFQIWQRGTTFSTLAANTVTADRWKYILQNTAGRVTITRDTDTPGFIGGGTWYAGNKGFTYSLKIDCTTADASVASTDLAYIKNVMEASIVAHRLIGVPITLSFWVKSTKTGTFSATLNNQTSGNNNTIYCIKEYTVNAADTWEFKTITFPAFTGNWSASDHLQIVFPLLAGSSFTSSTLGAWTTTTSIYASSNQVNALDDTANNFFLCGVQIEPGSNATSFKHLDFTTELLQCMGFYEKSFEYGTTPAYGVSWTLGRPLVGVQTVGAAASQAMAATIPYRVTKYAAASGSNTLFYNPVTAASAEFRNITVAADCTARSMTSASAEAITCSAATAAGSAAGNLMALHWATDVEFT